jgi:hypothetical protein
MTRNPFLERDLTKKQRESAPPAPPRAAQAVKAKTKKPANRGEAAADKMPVIQLPDALRASEPERKTVSMTFLFTASLAERIDLAVKVGGFRSRNAWVSSLLENYLP